MPEHHAKRIKREIVIKISGITKISNMQAVSYFIIFSPFDGVMQCVRNNHKYFELSNYSISFDSSTFGMTVCLSFGRSAGLLVG